MGTFSGPNVVEDSDYLYHVCTSSGTFIPNFSGTVEYLVVAGGGGGGGSAGTNDFGTLFGSLYPYGEGWGGNTGFSINGKFYHAKIYNRVLSINEVIQNFNSSRGIYGL